MMRARLGLRNSRHETEKGLSRMLKIVTRKTLIRPQ